MVDKNIHIIGCASGVAGADIDSGNGPLLIQKSAYLAELIKAGVPLAWDKMIVPTQASPAERVDEAVRRLCDDLATAVSERIRSQQFVNVVGGDHSCAIGTWSGVYDAIHQKGELGLIWIDAHMDSHTPETSESGRIHGMPLATLLGYGYSTLTSILNSNPKIKPENLCLIGVRSFERGEADLLNRLNIRVYYMDEIKQRGLKAVMQEAVAIVTRQTIAYGLTIDMDGIDPLDAPGVDVPEADGIRGQALCEALDEVVRDKRLIATELVEFDPKHDQNQLTEKLVVSLLEMIAKGHNSQ